VRATATTTCCGAAVAIGLLLPVAGARIAQATQRGPEVPGFAVAWRQPIPSTGVVRLAAADSTLLVSGPSIGTRAFAAADGTPRWARPDAIGPPPVLANGFAVVAAGVELVAMEADADRVRWTATFEDPVTQLAASGTTLLVATGDVVTRLQPADGRVAWSLRAPAPVSAAPALSDTHVFAPHGRGVTSWDLTQPTPEWRLEFDHPVTDVVSRGPLLIRSDPRGFFAVDPRSGWVSWRLQTAQTIGAPAADDARVYVAMLDNTVHGLDRRSGVRRWKAEVGGRPLTGPRLAGDRLVVALTSGVIVTVAIVDGTVERPPDGPGAAGPARDLLEAIAVSPDGRVVFVVTSDAAGGRTLTALRRGA
jgi:outer membrane protein assembly factor BamB